MQPSEMTNEELAKALMSRVPLDSNNHDDIREASARLRTFTLLSKAHQRLANDSVDYESNLLKKLKIAEDALEKIDNMCDGDMCKYFEKTHHCSACRYLDKCQTGVAHAALYEIRGKGGAK